ncbi:MAG: DUF1289 domain-containing protein [Gammaproteobacteria bacterium]|nr:DUF1289 domain-containing protein [Gammaproteobacteria bacterium]
MSQDDTAAPRRVGSPCVSVCLLDGQDVCVGCFRTADEITDWVMLDDPGRRKVLELTRERMREAGVLFE